jgi:hypothetical protein
MTTCRMRFVHALTSDQMHTPNRTVLRHMHDAHTHSCTALYGAVRAAANLLCCAVPCVQHPAMA